ncbi:MAG: hypothetical protein R8K50_09690, partial [Mariprofundus sp.]
LFRFQYPVKHLMFYVRIFEDNVTSTFFGPLCFLPNQDVIKIIKCIFPAFEEENVNNCDHIHFDFWRRLTPKEGTARKGYSIEPDLLVHFISSSTAKQSDFTLLIEVKWLGYKDGHDKHQVHEQIDAIQTRLDPTHLQAIYLTQYEDVNTKPVKVYEGVSIECMKWAQIAHKLKTNLDVSEGGKKWLEVSLSYLDKMLDGVFVGFTSDLFSTADKPSPTVGKVIFSPFHEFSKSASRQNNNTIFFEGK